MFPILYLAVGGVSIQVQLQLTIAVFRLFTKFFQSIKYQYLGLSFS